MGAWPAGAWSSYGAGGLGWWDQTMENPQVSSVEIPSFSQVFHRFYRFFNDFVGHRKTTKIGNGLGFLGRTALISRCLLAYLWISVETLLTPHPAIFYFVTSIYHFDCCRCSSHVFCLNHRLSICRHRRLRLFVGQSPVFLDE